MVMTCRYLIDTLGALKSFYLSAQQLQVCQGANVLHPIGWDAFGLPAEQYAIQTGTHPRITTERNINRFRQQLQSLGTCTNLPWVYSSNVCFHS